MHCARNRIPVLTSVPQTDLSTSLRILALHRNTVRVPRFDPRTTANNDMLAQQIPKGNFARILHDKVLTNHSRLHKLVLEQIEHTQTTWRDVDMKKYPMQYASLMKRYKGVLKAVDGLGRATKAAGPLNRKTSELIQLAAAAAIRSEGSVHSHARRAREAGAKPDEIRHALIVLTSTIGFPTVSAALSWTDDVLESGGRR